MPIAFSRSTRSLNNDRFFPWWVTLGVAILLLTAWAGWFFATRVGVYETSTALQMNRDQTLTATFPAGALARIRPGQPATVRAGQDADGQSTTLRAVVSEITRKPTEEQGQVKLHFTSAAPSRQQPPAELQIEVGQVSPAEMLLRSASRQLDAVKLPGPGTAPSTDRQGQR